MGPTLRSSSKKVLDALPDLVEVVRGTAEDENRVFSGYGPHYFWPAQIVEFFGHGCCAAGFGLENEQRFYTVHLDHVVSQTAAKSLLGGAPRVSRSHPIDAAHLDQTELLNISGQCGLGNFNVPSA